MLEPLELVRKIFAVSSTLDLNLPDEIGEGKALILFLTYIIVLFTILVQGLTLKKIVK